MGDYKVIHDPVHGSIKLDGLFLELSETPEIQRLHGIHQLGLAYLVFPGARHRRFEHSMGAAHIARSMADAVGLDDHEADLVLAAAFLHDVGHGPYSHTLEFLLHRATGQDHMEVTKEIIRGEYSVREDGDPEIPDVLERHDLDPAEVASFITGDCDPVPKDDFAGAGQETLFGGQTYLADIVHGPIDCDQLDYLLRDSHNTGVALGTVDLDRLLQTLQVQGESLVVDRKGISAAEGMLTARALMYSAVYFHKTVRIAELMVSRAAATLPDEGIGDLPRLVDAELMSRLRDHGGYAQEVVRRLKYRELYKSAYMLDADDLDEARRDALVDLDDAKARRRAEKQIAARADLEPREVIVDVPASELLVSEPRIAATNIPILDEGRVRPLSRYTPIARALASRRVPAYACLVACPARARDAVAEAAPTVLFG